jgi:hypothetical protein
MEIFGSMQHKTIEPLTVDRFILYESRLHPEGAQHIPLLTVNFDDENTDIHDAT